MDRPDSCTVATPALDQLLRVELAILVAVTVLVLFPYVRDPAVDTKILVYTWGGGIFAMLCALGYALRKRRFRVPTLLGGILMAFFAWFILAAFHASFIGYSIVEINKFLPLVLLYLIASQVYHTPQQVQRLLVVICAAAGLSVIYGISQHYGYDPFPWNPDLTEALKEAPGTFGNGNIAAHTTVLCIAMAVYLAAATRKPWYLGFALVFLVHLDLSNQRGGIIGLLAAAALLALAFFAYRRIRRPLPAIGISLGLLAVLSVAGSFGVMGIMKMRNGIAYPNSLPTLLRYHGYSGAAKMIFERPLLGIGPGNYRYENPRYWTAFEQEHFAAKHKMNYHAHNDVLEIGAEAGLPAAGLYLTFLVAAISYGLIMGLADPDAARRRIGYLFGGFFCAFLVDGLFGFNLRVPVSAMLLFLMAGALEGVWAGAGGAPPRELGRKHSMVVYGTVCILALTGIAFETRVFASEMLFQRAAGAIYYKAFPQAESLLTRGEALAPWNWEMSYQRGEIALRQYNSREAIVRFERALRRNPHFAPLMVSLAHAHLMLAEIGMADQPLAERMRMLDMAQSYTEKALELCPPLPEGEDMLGRIASLRATLLQQQTPSGADAGQIAQYWQEAEQHLNRAVDYRGRELDRIYLMLARARLSLGNKSGALDALIRAASANPANASLWPMFSQLAELSGQQDVFREALLSAAARLRRDKKEIPPGLDAVATAWSGGIDALNAAAASLAQAVTAQASQPSTPPVKDTFTWAADLLLRDLTPNGALEKPAAVAAYHLAVVYAAAGQWEKAANVFAACRGILPAAQLGDCAVVWAQALTQLKQDDKAIDVLRDAASRVSGDLRLQISLARALARNQRTAEARIEYGLILNQFQLNDRDRNTIRQELESLK